MDDVGQRPHRARSGRGDAFGYVRMRFGRNRQSDGREGEEIVRAKRDKNCPHVEGGRETR